MVTKTQLSLPQGHWAQDMSRAELSIMLEAEAEICQAGGWLYEAVKKGAPGMEEWVA